VDDSAEQKLIEQCQNGETAPFGQLVRAYQRQAYFIALGLTGNPEDALDLAQDAFIRAFKNIRQFDGRSRFRCWFFAILTHRCIDFLRKRRPTASLDDPDNQHLLRDHRQRFMPDALAIENEIMKAVWSGLGKLGADERQLILLKDFQDFRYKEIAEILGIPAGTVMSRLYHARRNLRREIETLGFSLREIDDGSMPRNP